MLDAFKIEERVKNLHFLKVSRICFAHGCRVICTISQNVTKFRQIFKLESYDRVTILLTVFATFIAPIFLPSEKRSNKRKIVEMLIVAHPRKFNFQMLFIKFVEEANACRYKMFSFL